MNHLLRALAPVTDAGWAAIEDEARERLAPALAARRLVDFAGPRGWRHSAVDLGRTERVDATPAPGVAARRRRVLPLVELRASFTVARSELEDAERGAVDIDLAGLDAAAKDIAVAENVAVFHGWPAAGIGGIAELSPHAPVPCAADFQDYPGAVARGVEALRGAGVGGPYGLALGPEDYTSVVETTEHGGYPLFDHLRKILGGPIVWAPGVEGALVLSLRGGDFLFESGQDIAVGYEHHDADAVQLFLEQSFSFRVATPEAAIVLRR